MDITSSLRNISEKVRISSAIAMRSLNTSFACAEILPEVGKYSDCDRGMSVLEIVKVQKSWSARSSVTDTSESDTTHSQYLVDHAMLVYCRWHMNITVSSESTTYLVSLNTRNVPTLPCIVFFEVQQITKFFITLKSFPFRI